MTTPTPAPLLTALFLCVPIWMGCAGASAGSGSPRASQGSLSRGTVLGYPPSVVWDHTVRVLRGASSDVVLDESNRIARAQVGSETLEIRIESYDSSNRKTILRVVDQGGQGQSPLAERVLVDIQRSLFRR